MNSIFSLPLMAVLVMMISESNRCITENSGAGNNTLSLAPLHSSQSLTASAAGPKAGASIGHYSWRNVEIGGTGFITGIIFHPKTPGLVYARTDIGGAYRWDEKDKRWVPLQDWVGDAEWSLLGVESLALDPHDAQRVYLAAGMYTTNWVGNGAILRSSDQGKTWEKTPVPFKFGGNEDGRSIGERLAVDPNRGSRLFLGTRQNGLWKSEDFGKTWQQDDKFPVAGKTDGAGIGFVIFDARGEKQGSPSSTVYVGVAASATSLYRSRDAGASWEAVPGQPQGLMPHHGVLTPEGILYLTYGNKPGPNNVTDGAVWKLDTADDKWTDITPVRPGANGKSKFGYAGLSVDATNAKTVMVSTMDRWAGGDDIFRSTDGGQRWAGIAAKAINDGSATPYILWDRQKAELGHWIGALQINPFDKNQVLYGTGQTIWGTEEITAADQGKPTRWRIWCKGIEESAVQSLLSPPAGPPLISGLLDAGGFRHDDLNASPKSGIWTNPIMSSVYSMDFAQNMPDIVVRVGASTKHGAFSTDGAKSWQPFANEPTIDTGRKEHPQSIAVAADGSTFVWIATDGVASVSEDWGATWRPCEGLGAKTSIASVIADRVVPRTFYVLVPEERALYVSKDGGNHFVSSNRDLPAQTKQLRASPMQECDLWLTSGNGLWHSENGGVAFVKLENVEASETLGFGKPAPNRTYDAIYLVGTVRGVHGVYRSDDKGSTWVRINDEEHRYGWIGQVITGDPKLYGRVYLGTNGRGIIYGDLPTE